jgi:hypothetical protein
MSAAHPAYLELVDFIAAGTTPEALIAFRPSDALQNRVQELISRKQDRTLTPDEESELEEFLYLEHILILAKAQARRHVAE